MSDYDPDKIDTEPLFRVERTMTDNNSSTDALTLVKMLMTAIQEFKVSIANLTNEVSELKKNVAVLADRDSFSKKAQDSISLKVHDLEHNKVDKDEYYELEERVEEQEEELSKLQTKIGTVFLTLKIAASIVVTFIAIGGYKIINILSGATP